MNWMILAAASALVGGYVSAVYSRLRRPRPTLRQTGISPADWARGNGPRPTIVVLCGSTRFGHAFREANLRETLAGRIVLSIGCDTKSDDDLLVALDSVTEQELKAKLDTLHLRKIDLADEVLVLNVNGYIGESTRREIEYATANNKPIRYLTTSGTDR